MPHSNDVVLGTSVNNPYGSGGMARAAEWQGTILAPLPNPP
jgi:hypothetical protein